MNINFIPLSESHFPLLLRWLNTPHVKQWWDGEIKWTPELIGEKYTSYVKGYTPERGVNKPIQAYIIYEDEGPVGYIQAYHAYDFPRSSSLEHLPSKLAAFDILIGEQTALRRGLGEKALSKFLKHYLDPHYTHIFADPDKRNVGAIRLYEKVGFRKVADKPAAEEVWMIRICPQPTFQNPIIASQE